MLPPPGLHLAWDRPAGGHAPQATGGGPGGTYPTFSTWGQTPGHSPQSEHPRGKQGTRAPGLPAGSAAPAETFQERPAPQGHPQTLPEPHPGWTPCRLTEGPDCKEAQPRTPCIPRGLQDSPGGRAEGHPGWRSLTASTSPGAGAGLARSLVPRPHGQPPGTSPGLWGQTAAAPPP